MYDAATDKTISASIGTLAKTDKTGPAVQSLKLLAQATGEYTREELNKDGKLGWTDKAAAEIAAAKASANGGNGGGGSSTGSDSGSGGSQNQGGSQGGSQSGQQGGDSQGGSQGGGQNQETGFALTITTSGSGSASVTHNGNVVTSGASLNEDDEVEISITPAEDQVPTATLNGSEVELTESGGVYTGNFAMPAQASTLVINTGTAEGDDGFDKD
ncbi:MAG: hypothetical protein J6T44_00715 [Prevotella sp.]|nr:hypothetical protein [Prevotella sp.]